jgi:hypothetical protein
MKHLLGITAALLASTAPIQFASAQESQRSETLGAWAVV